MKSAITVFIIEQDESIQLALARLMKAVGGQATCVKTIEELMEQKLPVKDAVIIADVSTVRQFSDSLPLALHSKDQTLPVIYLTEYDTESTRNEARRIGAAAYFRKPIDEHALMDAIAFSVQSKKAGQTERDANKVTPNIQ